ncbi:hypothetical protein [Sulfuritalea sp.]|uniref:hypothetical protein n=1 Tax=Sulfuritalea sp. TaxID=2480090 RepID=UPI001AD2E4E0|nr:hypothetical protein [Sulfuritalea sp.]MBN8475459.1 hypothetical protein [Sulfuritalea sp.]
MTGIRFATALLCIPALVGCSQLAGMPSAEPFPDATLRKAKSAEHWNIIAGDVAVQTTGLRSRPELQGKALYVSPSGDNSDFSRGFHSMLISKLVNGGLNVATRPEGAVQVTYEAQVVRHLAGQGDYQPGSVAALAGGIIVAREIAVGGASSTAKAVGVAALVAGADLLAANARLHSATNTEVIVTTSLVDNNRYLMRKTDVYYIEDAEGIMFEAPFRPRIKTLGVTGQ